MFHVTMQTSQADMGSQMETNLCTDTCTPSKHGVGTEMGETNSATQGHPYFHITIQWG